MDYLHQQLEDVANVVELVPQHAPQQLARAPEFAIDSYNLLFVGQFGQNLFEPAPHHSQPVHGVLG